MLKKLDRFLDAGRVFSLFKDEPYSSFLDSSMDPGRLGRFSFIGRDPFMVISFKDRVIKIVSGGSVRTSREDPFTFLEKMLLQFKTDYSQKSIPFQSGCVGYFSYDLRYFVEDLPSIAIDDLSMPDFVLSFYDSLIIFDNLNRETYISSTGFPVMDSLKQKERARARLEEMLGFLDNGLEPEYSSVDGLGFHKIEENIHQGPDKIISNFTRSGYYRAIEKAKEYIACGDIYQVNLSQRFKCGYDSDAYALYRLLRDINPSPFGAYLNLDEFKIVSSSPERFVKINARYIETRPIKGTRPRGSSAVLDKKLSRELAASAKDRAEHVMIVDLERNDLGRICEYGSVEVKEFNAIESYATVHHIVSTISGRLKASDGIISCLENCFPGGSITGAPKIRAMEIIEELEPTKRGIYTGSIGYIDFSGNSDLSIVIRTIVLKGRHAYFQVGGGIVADSDPEREYAETLDKALALKKALSSQLLAHSS